MNADFKPLIQWFTKQLDTGFKLHQNFPSAPSVKQDPLQTNHFPKTHSCLIDDAATVASFPEILFCLPSPEALLVEDEILLGLKTVTRRLITVEGVKPVGLGQWSREYDDLNGIAEPQTGASFFWEFSHLC